MRFIHLRRRSGAAAAAIMMTAVLLAPACDKGPEPPVSLVKAEGLQAPAPRPAAPAQVETVGQTPRPVAAEPTAPAPTPRELTAADRARLAGAPLAELAFVPDDVEAVLRVDLTTLVARARASDGLKTLDFILRAQQPAAWEALHASGIVVGRDITTLYLVVGPHARAQDSVLVAAMGRFDTGKLAEVLRKKGSPVVEPAPAPAGGFAALFTWKPSGGVVLGATEQPEAQFGAAAVALSQGTILLGTPDLVRRALATRSGQGKDVRASALTHDLLAVDTSATAWGVAREPGPAAGTAGGAAPDGYLADVLAGFRAGRLEATLATPGTVLPPEADGVVVLHAEFASAAAAEGFRGKLVELLGVAAMLGERSPLSATVRRLRQTATITVKGALLSATASL
jgi:hypothetical protein